MIPHAVRHAPTRLHRLPGHAHDGTLLFGYQNDNKWPIVKHVGGDNHFDPSPGDRGQPTIFQPGKHQKAFTPAVLPNEILKWALDDNVVTVPASAAKKCGDGDDEGD